MKTRSRFLSRTFVVLSTAVLSAPTLASATVIADLLATPFSTGSTTPNAIYKTETASLFVDPTSTTWMALSIGDDLRTTLPNLSGIPTIQSAQMNDTILLNVTLGGSSSGNVVLEDNNVFNQRVGNQAVVYGSFPSVGAFNGFTTSTYSGLPETGALTSFFDTNGPGLYTFDLSFLNRFGPEAGHFNVYLLREVSSQPAPEPGTLILLGAAVAWVGVSLRRL